MAYEIDALLGRPGDLARPPAPVVFPLTATLGLLPLTEEVRAGLGDVEAWAREASRGTRIARIGAEFFGGVGEHACTLWVDGAAEPLADINVVLARLGVTPAPGKDAFDTVALGRFRDTEDWLAEAVVSRAGDVAALLQDPRSCVRERAVKRVGDLRVAAVLGDADLGVRLEAYDVLARLGDEGRRHLEAALGAAGAGDLWGPLRALGSMGAAARPAAPRIVPLLEHGDWRTRLEAVRVLGVIGAVAAKPALERCLADQEDLVRKAAQDALRALFP